MYGALNPREAIRVVLIAFGCFMALGAAIFGFGDSLWDFFRATGFGAACFVVLLSVAFGLSGYWSPWRVLWRWFPSLNELIYPDLNGVWYGRTRSNWPVIQKVRSAASGGVPCDLSTLPAVELLEGEIAMELKASFFSIRVRSSVSQTGGDSHSTCVCAERRPDGPPLLISYLYRQNTPEPLSTDEGSHVGAATLEIKTGIPSTLSGSYWTRRKWREGMNTAGILTLTRVSERHSEVTQALLEVGRSARRSGEETA